jgi:hypothetical protein
LFVQIKLSYQLIIWLNCRGLYNKLKKHNMCPDPLLQKCLQLCLDHKYMSFDIYNGWEKPTKLMTNSLNNKNNNKIIKFRNKIKSQRGTLENGWEWRSWMVVTSEWCEWSMLVLDWGGFLFFGRMMFIKFLVLCIRYI